MGLWDSVLKEESMEQNLLFYYDFAFVNAFATFTL